MSYVAQRAVLATRTRVRDLAGLVPSLAKTAALTVLAALVALRWWQSGVTVPFSWTLPAAEALLLLPGAPVVGLLALRVTVGGRNRSVASQHLMTMSSRWAAAWAAVSAVWLAMTVSDLYGGGVSGLLAADNVAAVVASSNAAVAQVTIVWVALLVAFFGARLGRWHEGLGLLALAATALVAGVPGSTVVSHGHESASHPLVLVLAAFQLIALLVRLGA